MSDETTIRSRYDVVVAGARCSGAATAMLLARAGLDVLVVDPLPKGRDALSTHALMRGAVHQLHRWGLLDAVRASGAPSIAATTFDYGDESFTVPIKPKDGVDALVAPRRTVLDPILADAAEASGASIRRGWRVTGLVRDPQGRVRSVQLSDADGNVRTVTADFVIGADGLRSKVARLVGAEVRHQAEHATASMYGYWPGLETDVYRWYFRPAVGIGTIPTNGGESCVFASIPPADFANSRREGLEAVYHRTVQSVDPVLHERMLATGATPALRAFAGVPGFIRASAGPGWALVGDAGYFRDPLTAHGISDALRDAELLSRSLVRGGDRGLLDYEAERNRTGRAMMDVTDGIASLAWSMDEVKALHLDLSRAMNVGVQMIRGWDEESVAAVEPRSASPSSSGGRGRSIPSRPRTGAAFSPADTSAGSHP